MIPLLVVGAMLIAVPVVAVQGPAHTVPLDAVNVLFLGAYWCHLLARRARVAFPLLLPFWLVLVGSCGGLYSASDLGLAALTIMQDVYLYLWFVTLGHFLLQHCRSDAVARLWAGVAAGLALASLLDMHAGLLGGRLAGGQRAVGTFLEPNMFGNYLVVSFFLTWAAAAAGRRVLYLALPLLAAGLQATGSNGSLLALIAGCAATAGVHLARERRRAAGALLAAAGLGIAIVGAGWDELGELGLQVASHDRSTPGGGALKGYEERIAIWSDVTEIVREVPTGVGPGNLGEARGLRFGNYYSAHNEYVGMLGERGPLGLVGWCGILLGIGSWLWRRRPTAAGAPLAAAPLWGLLAAIVLHAGVIELSHFRHLWLALAVLWAAMRAPSVASASDPSFAVRLQLAPQGAS
jgi:O-antigen ligase